MTLADGWEVARAALATRLSPDSMEAIRRAFYLGAAVALGRMVEIGRMPDLDARQAATDALLAEARSP